MATPDGSMGVQAAYDALARFGAGYGELPLRLLLHVAIPQRFRADFVNLAKLNFLPEARGDLSLDADVLFAPVVESLGAGYFRLDGELRRQCLMLLDAAYRGQRELRSGRVADLFLFYLDQLSRNAAIGLDPMLEEYVTIERWVAFAFLSPSAAASRFAEALDRATKGEALDVDPVRIRFGGIAAALALPLSGQPELLDYARGYDALVSSNAEEARSIFERIDTGEIKVGDVILRPEALIAAVASKGVVDAPGAIPKISQGAATSPTSADGDPSKAATAVFVSSTYEDLREEREAVRTALLRLRCMPIGMEFFGSADEESWAFIKRQIEDSDCFVVIVADQYGSTAPDGLSYIEKEYDYAREIKKPVLAFVHGDRGAIRRDKTELDPEKRSRLEAFIEKLRRSPISFFTNPHDLETQVTLSLVNLRERLAATSPTSADRDPLKAAMAGRATGFVFISYSHDTSENARAVARQTG